MEEESLEEVEENRLKECLRKVLSYAEREGWRGYDPYDGLLSPFGNLPIPLYRLLFQQAVKRLPTSVRPLLLIPRSHNPKGVALFLWAHSMLRDGERANELLKLLMALRTELPGGGIAFGYNFNWQSSVFYVPAFTPNVIATSFSIFALREGGAAFGWDIDFRAFLPFYEKVLNLFEDGEGYLWMSYTPGDRLRIFNSSILGAVAYFLSGGDGEVLLRVGDTLAHYQREDGSWPYGLGSRRMNYVDHIHTAYNLWGLLWASRILGTDRWMESIDRGFRFYKNRLFNDEGLPLNRVGRHSHDTHDVAAAILTLKMFGEEDWAKRLAEYSCNRLVGPGGEVFNGPNDRRVFMRWSVGWLALSLAWLMAGNRPFPV